MTNVLAEKELDTKIETSILISKIKSLEENDIANLLEKFGSLETLDPESFEARAIVTIQRLNDEIDSINYDLSMND